ncbi:transferase activity, transferring acyl groups [Nesidiocoris tenuis]|uniref:Protein-serine O-palmitoleoyltransferase porcupine n=1 Tax=Nesidiocoris tenuis TaxID=355587 RepID=A0ABN7BCF0_9HEMI|nr:transferase activity, transferring acyl groups [Nesidiocoris tenuis]
MYDDLTYDIIDDGGDSEGFAYDDDYYEQPESSQPLASLLHLLQFCVKPTVTEAYASLLQLFAICLAFRAVTQIVRLPDPFHHLVSSLCGVLALYSTFGLQSAYPAFLALFGAVVIQTTHALYSSGRGYTVGAVFLLQLLLCELGLVSGDTWERIRGPQMVLTMKIVSYAFDLDSSALKFDAVAFLGYALCPGNLVFGPWTPFGDYMASFEYDAWDWKWLKRVLSSFFKSLFYFTLSVCFLEWAIPDQGSSKFALVYRDALLFRVGHYFVSFAAETSALVSGLWKVEITKPSAIEWPDSLVQVVIFWNLPIHRWLKTYVFRTSLPAGTFVAVMSTYLVSALLHGANAKLSAILLSLGLYTYVEHSLRSKMAEKFCACIGPRPCPKPCSVHKRHSTSNILVYAINLLFTLVAIFHLAYLGCILDTVMDTGENIVKDPFSRWAELGYVSHFMVGATAAIYGAMAIIW